MVFAIGPAGTGKTYTGVAIAVKALKNKQVKRIILTRPAVEAGENLGFLPGDLNEKLDPYMQPLYDALRDMIPSETLQGYFVKGIIQIAPLAFMRGRTLDNAFVILDEAQNSTHSQMKMFLTRMGKTQNLSSRGIRNKLTSQKCIIRAKRSSFNSQKFGWNWNYPTRRQRCNTTFISQKKLLRHTKQLNTITNISNVLINTDFKLNGLREKYVEKVRDVYKLKNNLLIVVVTDRISAFDVVYQGAYL